MADIRRLVDATIVPALAAELGKQIDSRVGNVARLAELGMPTRVAAEFVSQLTSGGDVRRLMELGFPAIPARQIALQVGGGTPTPPPPPTPANLLIVAGQSQALTSNTTTETVPASVAAPANNVFIWNTDLSPPAWEQYQAGLNSGPRNGFARGAHAFGPEAEIARAYAASGNPVPLYIVKLARPTTALQEAARSAGRQIWDPTLSNELAAQLKADRDAAVAALPNRTISYLGAYWDQGQNDGNNATAAATYGTALDAFHTWFRANIMGGNATAPFVVALLENSTNWSERATVRAAQLSFYDKTPGAQIFNSDSLAVGSDNVHFNAASTIVRGAEAYKLMRTGRPTSLVAAFSPSNAGRTFSDAGGTTPATPGQAVARFNDLDNQRFMGLVPPSGQSGPLLATDTITGRPVLDFSGGNRALASGTQKFVAVANGDDNPYTVVVGMRRGATAPTGSQTVFGWARKSTSSDYVRNGLSSGGGILASRTSNGTAVFGSGVRSPFTADVWYVATFAFFGQTITVRVNGEVIADNVALDTASLTMEEFSVGAVYAVSNNAYINSFTGLLDDIRIFAPGGLSAEVLAAEAEIAANLGVTLVK